MAHRVSKLLAATGAVLTCISIPSYAAVNGLTEQDEFNIKLRSIYFDRDYDNDASDDSTFAQGIELNYTSGYINDLVSVGVSTYTVMDINSTGSAAGNILPAGNESGGVDDSFSKFGQYFLDFKLGNNGHVKVGGQKTKSMLLKSSGSRAIPNTFRGVFGDYKIGNTKLYGYVYDKWSRRHDDRWEDFSTDQSATGAISVIWGVGATHKKDNLILEAEYLNSHNYLSKIGLKISYDIKLEQSKLTLSTGIFTSQDDGDLFVTGAEGGDLDDEDAPGALTGLTKSENDGFAYYLDADWKKDIWSVGAAFTKVSDAWIEDNFSGDHGTNPFPTRSLIGADLTNQNETSWQARLGIDFKAVSPGLTTKFYYTDGSDAENSALGKLGGTADEKYWAVDTRYKVEKIKGLSLRWLFVDYTTEKSGSVDGVKGDRADHRVYVDYTIKF
ncbi:OprD family porin [Pseudoalteromonas arctica]|uniref:OprD family outer membrane porin n=1 Tax=Pseudoalteromonas arctica TaxID=394751 RepID=UPI00145C30F9|nr:OprD family outer membrane porin [Pseudoalteromonas arctica]NMP79129.1 OprD family porin [Pseudoalteromonas arctica]